MNSTDNITTTESSPVSKTQREYHNGPCTFRHSGRKWHFTTPGKDGKPFTAIIQLTGGFEVANRIAPLVTKDVARSGGLGSNRANIQRLIDAAK